MVLSYQLPKLKLINWCLMERQQRMVNLRQSYVAQQQCSTVDPKTLQLHNCINQLTNRTTYLR